MKRNRRTQAAAGKKTKTTAPRKTRVVDELKKMESERLAEVVGGNEAEYRCLCY